MVGLGFARVHGRKKGRQVMNLATFSTMQIIIAVAIIAVVVLAFIGVWQSMRKRRTEKLRAQFGGAEYTRAVTEGGSQQKAEAALNARAERVEKLHIKPLGPGDRARFIESWAKLQARFVDGPGSAVTDADQLLGDVMSTRGYPVSDFEQRAADISVDHPLVLENYRAAHQYALRQTTGKASTEELRQAMIHYRTLFEELVNEPEIARAQTA
jgi:type II secretory pathway pseudopilin PulG